MRKTSIIAISFILASILFTGCNNDKMSNDEMKFTGTDWKVNTTYKVGEKPMFGFYHNSHPIFTEGVTGKHAWVFYDDAERFKGKRLKVVGIRKETGKEIVLIKDLNMYVISGDMVESGNMNPEKTIVPSGFSIPSAGLWRLNVYVDSEFYGYLVVNVEEHK